MSGYTYRGTKRDVSEPTRKKPGRTKEPHDPGTLRNPPRIQTTRTPEHPEVPAMPGSQHRIPPGTRANRKGGG